MANKKNKWLRDKLKSLSKMTGKGIHRKIRGFGKFVGTPFRIGLKGVDWYTKAKAREKANKANWGKARTVYKNKFGHSLPVNQLYWTPEMRKKGAEALRNIKKLEEKAFNILKKIK